APDLSAPQPPADLLKRIGTSVEKLAPHEPPGRDLVDALTPDAPASVALLRERARHLERQAAQLRDLAQAVHQQKVFAELTKATQGKDEEIDLLHAALLVARLDNDDLDADAYRKEVERMARELTAALPKDADEKAKLAALDKYLFAERGFHGSRTEYY